MSLDNLLEELTLLVLSFLVNQDGSPDVPALLRVSLVCKRMSRAAAVLLYRKISCGAILYGSKALFPLLNSLARDPSKRALVKELRLSGAREPHYFSPRWASDVSSLLESPIFRDYPFKETILEELPTQPRRQDSRPRMLGLADTLWVLLLCLTPNLRRLTLERSSIKLPRNYFDEMVLELFSLAMESPYENSQSSPRSWIPCPNVEEICFTVRDGPLDLKGVLPLDSWQRITKLFIHGRVYSFGPSRECPRVRNLKHISNTISRLGAITHCTLKEVLVDPADFYHFFTRLTSLTSLSLNFGGWEVDEPFSESDSSALPSDDDGSMSDDDSVEEIADGQPSDTRSFEGHPAHEDDDDLDASEADTLATSATDGVEAGAVEPEEEIWDDFHGDLNDCLLCVSLTLRELVLSFSELMVDNEDWILGHRKRLTCLGRFSQLERATISLCALFGDFRYVPPEAEGYRYRKIDSNAAIDAVRFTKLPPSLTHLTVVEDEEPEWLRVAVRPNPYPPLWDHVPFDETVVAGLRSAGLDRLTGVGDHCGQLLRAFATECIPRLPALRNIIFRPKQSPPKAWLQDELDDLTVLYRGFGVRFTPDLEDITLDEPDN